MSTKQKEPKTKAQQGRAAREKGKRGEREIVKILNERGIEARRGEQYCGANGDADVIGLNGVHIEVKRCERFLMDKWMDQSISDAREDEVPVLFFRRNGEDWKVCMLLDDFLDWYEEINEG